MITMTKIEPSVEVDTEGRQVTRIAAGKSGWVYLADVIEIQTSKLNSLYYKDEAGNNIEFCTLKFYNDSNEEVTDEVYENTITKTVLIFKPNHDYELVSGSVHQIEKPSADLRLWVSAGILELGGSYVKHFAKGINMAYIGADEQLKTDGRAAKYMVKDINGVPYQANQIKFLIKHNAGIQHKLMIILEYFRA